MLDKNTNSKSQGSADALHQVFPDKSRRPSRGMSPFQRFIVAFVVFLMTAVIGVFILVVFQKIILPF